MRRLSAITVVWALVSVVGCASPASVSVEQDEHEVAAAEVRIALGGDVMFGRWNEGVQSDYLEESTLAAAAEVFDAADLSLVNLETAVCSGDAARAAADELEIQIAARPAYVPELAASTIDVVSLANNHATDCGPNSLATTRSFLDGAGIAAVGIEQVPPDLVRRVEGTEVVVTAATVFRPEIRPGEGAPAPRYVPRASFHTFVERVAELRAAHPDAVVVASVHWGVEFARQPSPWQRRHARALIGAGADIVHGHGSHTVQEVETYRGGAIAYGLGNLHFDMTQRGTRRRAVAVATCRVAAQRACRIDLQSIPRPQPHRGSSNR